MTTETTARPADRPLDVLIACEFTGTVRRQFDKLGHNAWSCDLRRAEDGSNRHIIGDAREVVKWGWDLLIIAHPPCTRLCNSGVRWIDNPSGIRNLGPDFNAEERAAWSSLSDAEKHALMQVKLREGAALFSDLWNAPIEKIACENPVMHKHAKALIEGYQPPAQSVQPWQYGDWETKRTCLWLKGLEPLVPTYRKLEDARAGLGKAAHEKPIDRVHKMPPGPDRERERSRFFDGIAEAMAMQWGGIADPELAELAA